MLQDILIPAGVVLLSELADKTQLLIISLSSRNNRGLQIFLAAMLAFVLVDGAAVVFGSIASGFLPHDLIRAVAAIAFILLGIKMLHEGAEHERKVSAGSGFPFFFSLLFFSEFGDKSQLAAMLLSTQFNPWLAIIGIIAALGTMTLASILIGKTIAKLFHPKLTNFMAAVVFMTVGMFMLA